MHSTYSTFMFSFGVLEYFNRNSNSIYLCHNQSAFLNEWSAQNPAKKQKRGHKQAPHIKMQSQTDKQEPTTHSHLKQATKSKRRRGRWKRGAWREIGWRESENSKTNGTRAHRYKCSRVSVWPCGSILSAHMQWVGHFSAPFSFSILHLSVSCGICFCCSAFSIANVFSFSTLFVSFVFPAGRGTRKVFSLGKLSPHA